MNIKLSSRQSVLAKIQAYQVGAALQSAHQGLGVDFLFRESLGDKNLTDPLWKIPEKGVFTEDFYRDLVSHQTDLVVHSWKDLPTEGKPDTEIVATLPRADQRDLLLLKKSSAGKSRIQIYSSSPRRSCNIKEFLGWALPWKTESLEFTSVRGNIPTRVQKLLEDPATDGLILAKAAMDRLLTDGKFPETIAFLRQALAMCQWMVLPLSENPNAAAQGALAIEIASDRPDIREMLKPIQCEKTFTAARREREILSEFGGGCHLALGMSVLVRNYGKLEIVRGLTPQGEKVHVKKFYPSRKPAAGLKIGQLEFGSERQALLAPVEKVDALFVAKADAWTDSARTASVVWTAGLKTWRKLAGLGVWVHGSAESLGESEDPRVEILAGRQLEWGRLTHEQALDSLGNPDKKVFGSYRLNLKLVSSELGEYDAYRWKSGSEFLLAQERFPEIRKRIHFCGPGRTFETIRKALGHEQNIYVELNDEFITVV